MKRLLSLLLCLLLCLALPTAARAEAAPVLTANIDEGDIVLTLTVTEDLNEVCGLHIRFTVPEGFAYDAARPVRIHEGFTLTANAEQLDFAMDSLHSAVEIKAGDALLTLCLTMPDELAPGHYPFQAEITEAYDWDFGDLPIKGMKASAEYVQALPGPTIVQQPQSVLAAEGETVSFSAVCDNDLASYRWYCRSGENADWAVCTEAGWDSDTLTLQAVLSLSGTQYRCEATTRTGSVISETATLTVLQAPEITLQPQSASAPVGEHVSFTVAASGTDLSYIWYYRTDADGAWAKYSSTSTPTLTVETKAYRSGYQYSCLVSNPVGSVRSEAATLIVLQKPTITAQPQSASAAIGENVTFSVTASDATGYVWYYRTSSTGTWAKYSSTAGASITVEAKAYRSGYQYFCIVSNAAGSVSSKAATLTVR